MAATAWDWSYLVGGSSSDEEDTGALLPVRRSNLDFPDDAAEEEEALTSSNRYNPRRRRQASSATADDDEPRPQFPRSRPLARRDEPSSSIMITLPVRCLALLFVIATYVTLMTPYPQDYLEESGGDDPSAAAARYPHYPMLNSSRTDGRTSIRPGQKQMAFARGDPTSPITFRRTAHEFYQQEAIQEQVWGILPWYANVGLLVFLAVWVLVAVVCQQRRRNSGTSRLLDEYD